MGVNMRPTKSNKLSLILACSLLFLTGCINTKGNIGNVQSYPIPTFEAQWIRNGEPIEFEGERWYPADSTENLQDSEILLMGEHRGIQFFIDKLDVRPYNRLYTKFGRNKFRYFQKRTKEDDPGFASHQEL